MGREQGRTPPPQTGRGKRPLSRLAGPYGHPAHPLLVTVPIGAWVASLTFDIASRLLERPDAFAWGAFWLIALGVVVAIPAAVAGLLDLVTLPGGTRAFRIASAHGLLASTVVVLHGAGLVVRYGALDDPVGAGPIALSAIALALLALVGVLGGELAYRYGVRVAEERDQLEGFRT